MIVHIYSDEEADDGKHLGTWYSENREFPQVPRVGDIVWLETKEIRLERFVCQRVEWSFKNRSVLGEVPRPRVGAEVYVKSVPSDDRTTG